MLTVAVYTDITELKQAEREMARAIQEIRQARAVAEKPIAPRAILWRP